MNKLLVIVMCFAIPLTVLAGDNSYKVTYDGGSLPDAKAGAGMKLFIEANQVRLVKDKADVVTIPASAITEISYGQDVHRRVGAAIGLAVVSLGVGALMALTKSKKHYVGITWADGDKKGGLCHAMRQERLPRGISRIGGRHRQEGSGLGCYDGKKLEIRQTQDWDK